MSEKINQNKRQIQKQQTRKQLIESAIMQYAKNGFTATKTADIAKAAGVSHGTVFTHFPTQEALLNAVIEEFGLRVSQRLHELAAGNHSLQDVLKAHLTGLIEFEDFYARLVAESRLLPDSTRKTLIMIQTSISFHISQAAQRDMECGIIGIYPMHLVFNTWIGLIHYYLMNDDIFAPEGSVLERYGEELLNHYMRLISEKEDKKGLRI